MKMFYMFILLISMTFASSGQVFLWETFDENQMPPTGWSIDGFTSSWSINYTGNAGGTTSEGMFTRTFATGISYFISPSINLSGLASVRFSFKHFYDFFMYPSTNIGVATRSGGGTWTSVWEINPIGNAGPEQINLEIMVPGTNPSDFQICLYISGNFQCVNFWYIDDLFLFEPLNVDGSITSITTQSLIVGPSPVTGTIINTGLTPITSLEINWQLNDEPIQSTSLSGLSILTQENYSFICDDEVDAPIGENLLTVWINKVNGVTDDDQLHDTLSKTVKRSSFVISRMPCFEEFTSSCCTPCAVFNESFDPWCEEHKNEITLIKYQMDWPSPGDPYYTEEGGIRRYYYGVFGVPSILCNGDYFTTNIPSVQMAFNSAIEEPGLVDIVASHHLNETEMTVSLTALPFVNFTNVMVHVIVFEYITTGNVGTNGETEFHHVMMKMMPDGSGTTTDLIDRVSYSLDQTQDLDSTFVEEWDDLGVLVFIQDIESKEIYQSVYSIENGSFSSEARLNDILVDGGSIPGFDPNDFTYDVEVRVGSLIPDITGIPMDEDATVIVIPATEILGTTTIQVFAENLKTTNTYSVNFTEVAGLDAKGKDAIRIYPNPTTGLLSINGATHASIKIFNSHGVEVMVVYDFAKQQLDISTLTDGVYLISILTESGDLVRKKVVLVK